MSEFGVDGLCSHHAGDKEGRGDDQVDPAMTKDLLEFASIEFVAILKVVVDRLLQSPLGLQAVAVLTEMNDKLERSLERVLLSPADDELLCLGIKIPFMKGGGIDRVKDLLEGLDFDLNQLIFGLHGHFITVKGTIMKERTARG